MTLCCSVNVSEASWKKQDVLLAFVSAGWNSAGVNSQLYFVKALRCSGRVEKKRKMLLCLPWNTWATAEPAGDGPLLTRKKECKFFLFWQLRQSREGFHIRFHSPGILLHRRPSVLLSASGISLCCGCGNPSRSCIRLFTSLFLYYPGFNCDACSFIYFLKPVNKQTHLHAMLSRPCCLYSYFELLNV